MMKKDLSFYEFKGNHYEMGVKQGMAFRNNLLDALRIVHNHEGFNNLKPKYLPSKMFYSIAARKAKKALKPLLEQYAPRQAERLRGIAEGSGISIDMLYLLNSLEIFLGEPDYELKARTGCTSIGYHPSFTESSHSMISRNFDFEKFIVDLLQLRKNVPVKGYTSWDLSASPLPGTFNGVNEKGLFISTDETFALKEVHAGLPASIIIQEALENCSNSEDAFEFISNLPRGSSNVFLINDADGNLIIAEYTSERIFKRPPSDSYVPGKYAVATNHFEHPTLKPIDLPRDAVFGKNSPALLRGIPINETSYIRIRTAVDFFKGKRRVGIHDIMQLHRDHGTSDGKGGFNDICHHDPVNITAASMIFDLDSLEAWILIGLPCQNDYIHFSLKEI